jgi:NADH dehydrogenase (ubiquinone) Fe-S protein 3
MASYAKLGKYIQQSLPKHIQRVSLYKDELTLHVPPSSVVPVIHFLKDHTTTQFKQLMDVCGVDYPTRENRFEVVYHLLSLRYNTRVRVKTYASETSNVPSLTPLFKSADWFEREAWLDYYLVTRC